MSPDGRPPEIAALATPGMAATLCWSCSKNCICDIVSVYVSGNPSRAVNTPSAL
jgi:hypothetical protein